MRNPPKVRIMPDGSTRVGDAPWPAEVKELAFELWYLKFHRNMQQVLDYLNGMVDQDIDHPADDLSIEYRDTVVEALSERKMKISTLYQWAKRERWAEKVEKLHRQIAPAIYKQVDTHIEVASIDAAKTLIDLLNRVDTPPKIRLDAANSILDRTGHTAWVRPSDDGKISGPQQDYSTSIAGKSGEELLKMIMAGDGSSG